MTGSKNTILASTLVVGLMAHGGVAQASEIADNPEPRIETAEAVSADVLTDAAWGFAESMGATLSEAAGGTWSTVAAVSSSVSNSVTTTWDQTLRATEAAATPSQQAPSQSSSARETRSMSFGDMISAGWNKIKGLFGYSASVAAPSSTADWLSQLNEENQTGFWTLLGDAGYKLKEIDTTIGLIPEVKFKYAYSRELSEADKAWLERKLDRLARDEPGPVAALQRTIIHGILEGNETDGFIVETVYISLLPLPEAEFSMSPVDAPLPEELDRIYRAVIGKKRRGASE